MSSLVHFDPSHAHHIHTPLRLPCSPPPAADRLDPPPPPAPPASLPAKSPQPLRSDNSHSAVARSVIMSQSSRNQPVAKPTQPGLLAAPQKPLPAARPGLDDFALNDTPATTAPSSPRIPPLRQNSIDKIRQRPTTLDIPGLTKSKVSPDGRISQRDVGAKLVIVMVGLPARGKSYITKKMARYLNWLQHDTKIFNVGERRRVAAGTQTSRAGSSQSAATPAGRSANENSRRSQDVKDIFRKHSFTPGPTDDSSGGLGVVDQRRLAADVLINGGSAITSSPDPPVQQQAKQIPELNLPEPLNDEEATSAAEVIDQSASFFDPSNRKAALLREQVALETLDELLDYLLNGGGSVGILDATNSTLERRKLVMKHIRQRAPDLNVLFVESMCVDENLLDRNMRLKLSGPDYAGKDPEASLADFKKRVEIYEKAYVPLGDYEEKNNMSFVQMIDVGRKIISHQIKGFLSAQAVYYLLNFNLAPRQIWITRHGQSVDNLTGKIGGDSELSPFGHQYARDLTKFVGEQKRIWEIKELDKEKRSRMPPRAGDTTPPNPHYAEHEDHIMSKHFCVWTSMLKRSVQTAEFFDEEEFEIKQMRMLNELYSGSLEGYTYEEIHKYHNEEFESRRKDKLQYRYPGPGGEGYLDVINRLRPVIHELERMTDHCLLIGHRSVARVLLAYFKGLPRDQVTDLDVPIGTLYCLEPKPYGVDLKVYRHNSLTCTFEYVPDYRLQKASSRFE